MIAVETYTRAEIKVRREGKPTLDFGSYRFRVLPRVGEQVHIYLGETPHCLKIETIEHFAYTENATPTLWDSVIKLTCEAID